MGIWLGIAAAKSRAGEAPSLLTRVEQVRTLAPAEAERSHSVRLTGVVTFSDPERGLLWVQDATGGVFVAPQARRWDWPVGQKVGVTGVAARGSHLPFVAQGKIEDLGAGTLPNARRVTFSQLSTDAEDGNWVEIRGVVRHAGVSEGRPFLEIAAEGRRLRAVFLDAPPPNAQLARWIDAECRVQGVCGMVSRESNAPLLLQLHVSSLTNLVVEVARLEQPFAVPAQTIASLAAAISAPGPGHRVRLKGTLRVAPEGGMVLTDGTGSAAVQPVRPEAVETNAEAEVLGFPAGTAQAPRIEDAVVHFLGLSWPEKAGSLAQAARESLPVLTQASEVRQLPRGEIQRGYPVRLRGVVTYVDTVWQMLFVQDETAGIYVYDSPFAFRGAAGGAVQVEGYTGSGKFAPIIREPRFQLLGTSRMPAAKTVTLDQLEAGGQDAQRVEIAGVVKYLKVVDEHLQVNVRTSGGLIQAFVPGFKDKATPDGLVDAEVLIRGICGSRFNDSRQVTSVQLHVADLKDLQVVKPPPKDVFALPVSPIESLLQFQAGNDLRHRIHVRGTVIFRDPNWCTLFLQDESRSIYVRALEEPKVTIGDLADVAGFVVPEARGPAMSEAVLRRIGPGQAPAPRAVTIQQAISGENDGYLVTLEGRLVDWVSGAVGRCMVLQSGEWTFLGNLESSQPPGDLASLRRGSLLRLTGICCAIENSGYVGTRLSLQLRWPGDVVVVQRPPWWTTRHWLALLGLALGVLAATTMWVWSLRRSVRNQTALLRENERRQRAILDNIPDPAWLKDVAGRFLAVNEAWCRLTGVGNSAALGKSSAEVMSAEAARQLSLDEATVIRSQRPIHKDEGLADVQKQTHWYQTTIAPILDDRQVVVGTAGIARDISERKRAEAALRQSQTELAAIYDITPIIMCLINEQREVERFNQALRVFFGQGAVEGGHRRLGDLLACVHAREDARGCGSGPHCPSCCLEMSVAETFRTGQPCRQVETTLELPPQASQKEITVLVSTVLVRLEASSKVLLCLEDITGRKQLQAQFLQAQKMEAIGQLAGGVAHDFNNILAAIMMNLSLLRQNPEVDGETKGGLEDLEKDAQRAANLTRQLLLFSRRQIVLSKRLDLSEVVDNLMKMLQRLLGEHIEIVQCARKEAMWVNADEGMLEQVVMNLCVNARDAMPKGGRLTLRVGRVDVTPEAARAQSEARVGRFVCLGVSDTGVGMDPETMQHVFEPFFTTKGVGKGTGLGLATVYGIARLHQGWVEVESALGRGTTFRLYLPAGEVGASAKSTAESEHAIGGTEMVLVVEDSPSVRRLTTLTLRRLGYRVMEAPSGVEAVKLWAEHGEQIDLLFTDMVMPEGMSGMELARRLCELKPSLKVIVSSGYSADLLQDGVVQPPGVRFLAKPYQPGALAKMVRACLDERTG